MADRPAASSLPDQNENSLLTGQSKEAAIINNNLVSLNRAFGRDISNLRVNESKSQNNLLQKQEIQSFLASDTNITDSTKVIEGYRSDGIDLGSLELPKTTRDPLLASRELLSLKPNIEKEKVLPKVEVPPKRPQKVPMSLFTMENCDILEVGNPQYVSVYAKEIFDHLLSVEEKLSAKYGYMTQIQTEVNERMRAILIDWIVDIHIKFKLQSETLYLTVNLIDRFLERVPIAKPRLQLVGVTAMMIASKYQEIYPPELKDFIYVSDKAYRKEEILEMEGKILQQLQFNLTVPSMLSFLDRYSRLAGLDQKTFYFCQYVIEQAMIEYRMLKYRPSLIVCGTIQLANRVFKRPILDDALVRNTNYDEEVMNMCMKDLLLVLKNVEKSKLQAVKRKFLSSQFMEAAKTPILIP
jgi:hypothetical protein